MLEQLRTHGSSWAIKVIFGVIVLVFIFWGYGAGNMSDPDNDYAVKVNGKRVSFREFQYRYQQNEQEQRARSKIALNEAQERFLAEQTLDELIERELVLEFAKEAGLVASPAEIADYIKTKSMTDETGKFIGRQKYLEKLREANREPIEYEESLGEMLTEQKAREFFQEAVKITPAEVRDMFDQRAEKVSLSFVQVDKVGMAQALKATPVKKDEIDAWLAANPGKVETLYAEQKDIRWTAPAKVELHQITIRKPLATKKGAADDLAAAKRRSERAMELVATDWKKAAEQYSEGAAWEKSGQPRDVSRREMQAAVADAVFALSPEDPPKLVETPLAFVIVKVKSVTPEKITELDEPLKKTIVEEKVREQKALAEVETFAKSAYERLKKGEKLEKIAESKGLAIKETGGFPKSDEIPGIPDAGAELVNAAFALAKPGDALGLADGPPKIANGYILAVLKEHTHPTPEDFDKQKGWIEGGIKSERAREAFNAWKADRIAKSKIQENPRVSPGTS